MAGSIKWKPETISSRLNATSDLLAAGDLEAGRDFYERQQPGFGIYFLDTLFSDTEAMSLHAGVHERSFGYLRALPKRFLMTAIY